MHNVYTDAGILLALLMIAGSRKLKYMRIKLAEEAVSLVCNMYVELLRIVMSVVALVALSLTTYIGGKV